MSDLLRKRDKTDETELSTTINKKLKDDGLSYGNTVQSVYWWENTNFDVKQNSKDKWGYLEHKGVFFPGHPKYHGLKIQYDGREILLDEFQEEIAIFWTQSFGSEFHENPYFKKNFGKIFVTSFKDRT